jgi:hypothetical protein
VSRQGVGTVESIAEINHRIATGGHAARPITFGEVTFRSKLEARFSWHLDAIGVKWVYEPRVFGRPGEGYLPDFQLLGLDQPTYVEVKPTIAEIREACRRMKVIWEQVPDALLIVACEEGRTFVAAVNGRPWESWQERWGA